MVGYEYESWLFGLTLWILISIRRFEIQIRLEIRLEVVGGSAWLWHAAIYALGKWQPDLWATTIGQIAEWSVWCGGPIWLALSNPGFCGLCDLWNGINIFNCLTSCMPLFINFSPRPFELLLLGKQTATATAAADVEWQIYLSKCRFEQVFGIPIYTCGI